MSPPIAMLEAPSFSAALCSYLVGGGGDAGRGLLAGGFHCCWCRLVTYELFTASSSLSAITELHHYACRRRGGNATEIKKPGRKEEMKSLIAELAEVHPGLMTFKTTDLSPASWISVASLAWYPIYQIPTKGNHKDSLSTCIASLPIMLSHHHLFEFLFCGTNTGGVKLDKDGDKKGKKVLEMVKGEEGNNNIKKSTVDVLNPYPFGLATYRLDDEIWINGNTFDDYERIIDLYNAAKCWLKRLNVWHHDFNFFTSKLSLQGLSL
nr:uncharacterized protein LOC109167854 [Ipomoea trifida]